MEMTLGVLNRLVDNGVIGQYAVGGAMGAMFYSEPISTFDLDIFVVLPRLASGLLTLAPLYEHLSLLGYKADGECIDIEGVPVQFLPAYNELVEEGLREATILAYGSTPVRVLTAEHLIAIAIQTGREKDRIRVRMLLDEATIDMSRLDGILQRHALTAKGRLWLG
jgi:hypothetical protein